MFHKRVSDEGRLEAMLSRLHQALRVRGEVQWFIGTGTFLDSQGITAAVGITATRWQARDGSTVLLAANSTGELGELRVELPGESEVALQVLDGTTGAWQEHRAVAVDGHIVIQVPPALFSAARWHVEGSEQ